MLFLSGPQQVFCGCLVDIGKMVDVFLYTRTILLTWQVYIFIIGDM
jgi:hypothetical protein